nr:abnormal long morphology protein 1-like isoform X2 [Ipomoea batatas]
MAAQGEILDLEAQLAAVEVVETALTKEAQVGSAREDGGAVTTETEEKATNREEEMQNLEKELAEKDALVERLKLELFVGDGGEAINGEFGKAHDEVVALNHNIGKMNPEVDEIIS